MGVDNLWARITGGRRLARESSDIIAAISKQINQLRMNLTLAYSKGSKDKLVDQIVIKNSPAKYYRILAEIQASGLSEEEFDQKTRDDLRKIKNYLKIN